MKRFFPVLALILGLYWVVQGTIYGLWTRQGPGPGFLPVIAGVLAVVFSLAVLVASRKDKSESKFTWKAFLPVAALIAVVLSSYVLGLIVALAIYIFLWLRFMEKYQIKKSLIIGISCAGILYIVFGVWLKVPFPLGIFELL